MGEWDALIYTNDLLGKNLLPDLPEPKPEVRWHFQLRLPLRRAPPSLRGSYGKTTLCVYATGAVHLGG